MKKKRCAICGSKLGLGVRFRNFWTTAGWKHLRFCGKRCEDTAKRENHKGGQTGIDGYTMPISCQVENSDADIALHTNADV
jgi:hypothetical protein